jgi:hypothetical protein
MSSQGFSCIHWGMENAEQLAMGLKAALDQTGKHRK